MYSWQSISNSMLSYLSILVIDSWAFEVFFRQFCLCLYFDKLLATVILNVKCWSISFNITNKTRLFKLYSAGSVVQVRGRKYKEYQWEGQKSNHLHLQVVWSYTFHPKDSTRRFSEIITLPTGCQEYKITI